MLCVYSGLKYMLCEDVNKINSVDIVLALNIEHNMYTDRNVF